MLLSFHPIIEGDINRLCAGRDPGPEDLAVMEKATAILLPQGCREALYRAARRACVQVFPNYEARFTYPGKTGQVKLFRHLGLPHPESLIFANCEDFNARYPNPDKMPLAPPLMVKRDWGGEGQGVYPAPDRASLNHILQDLERTESALQSGFVIQRFIPTAPRVLRVVVIGAVRRTYWRVMAPGADPYARVGLSQGGHIDDRTDPNLMRAAETAVVSACRATGIDLAAFDLIFSSDPTVAAPDKPIFLEINYFFGRRGLGGSEGLYNLLAEGLRDWLPINRKSDLP